MTEPSAGAMRASLACFDRINGAGINEIVTQSDLAETIDEQTGLPDLIEALEASMGLEVKGAPLHKGEVRATMLAGAALAKAKGES